MQGQGHDHAHSSPIKTPKQLVTIIVLAFLLPVLGIVLLTQLITSSKKADPEAMSAESIARRIKPVADVVIGDAQAPAGGAAEAKSGEDVYKTVCQACHAQGVAGAPKLGDKAAWAAHLKEGLDSMSKNAINGIRGMPARGGNPGLSDVEVTRAVVYMANAAGGSFKEPAAPKAAAPVAAAAPAAAAPAPAPAQAAAAPAGDKGATVYKQACVACHDAGVAGAPKLGDKGQWSARVAQGKDTLYDHAIKGKGAMPPKGGNMALADADVKAAVDYMLGTIK